MQQLRVEEISALIKKRISDFDTRLEVSETGTIISVGDGVARVHGLDRCLAGEMLELPGGTYGLALNLEEDNVGVALFGGEAAIK
jgi:F-type H+/Na+-transporting ATPase subunit alpha